MFGEAKKRTAILEILADGEWYYGLDIVERSNGRLRVGTVYVWLSRMQDAGLIEGQKEEDTRQIRGGKRRMRYRLVKEADKCG